MTKHNRVWSIVNYLLMSVVALLFIAPVLFMVAGSFKPGPRC